MPTAWRIARSRHADRLWDGEGARLHGGRWNSPGVPVAYASESRALALLEVLVRLEDAGALAGWVLADVRFPDDAVEGIEADRLPRDWRRHPPSWTTQRIGDAWAAEARTPVLRVPSVVVPRESNFLINPGHPEWDRLILGEAEAFDLDPRLANP